MAASPGKDVQRSSQSPDVFMAVGFCRSPGLQVGNTVLEPRLSDEVDHQGQK